MLQVLRRIIQEVSSSKDLREALTIIVQRVSEITHAEACSVFLVDETSGEYVLMATEGLNKKMVAKLRIKPGDGLIGLVAEREEPLNVANTVEHPRFCHYSELSKNPYHAFLGVPIIHQRELLGILVAQKSDPNSFVEDEETFLITLSAQIAGVIAVAKATGAIANLTRVYKDVVLNGLPSVPGVGIGKIVVVYPLADVENVPDKKIKQVKKEITLFNKALKAARLEVAALRERIAENINSDEKALFDAYLQILDSPSLKKDISLEIKSGNWAPGALSRVIKHRVAQFKAMEDEYLQERAIDILDLGRRILAQLQSGEHKTLIYPDKTILVGTEITATDIAAAPQDKLVGIVSLKGSASCHAAILARTLGVPTIMGMQEYPLDDLNGKKAIVDGYYGQLYIAPRAEIYHEFVALAEEERELNVELESLRNVRAETLDGYTISLLVNTGLPVDVGQSLRVGAEGVGLYRTEVPFMMRSHFPSAEEQRIIYRQVLKVFAPRPVTMRTLDIGGDKTLPYFPITEANPFLGWRGIRITLDHPEIFLLQIKAMLRANVELNNLRIMLPMVSNINEIEDALRLIKQAYNELAEEDSQIVLPKIGAMVEVPAAVYLAQDLARRLDFLSVGSNDLTQYLLAVDRNNPHVANLYDGLHPAVLHALQQIVQAAHREGKEVSLCGEMAGDPTAAIILLALGFDALSLNANQLLRIKWLIRKFTMQHAQQLLNEVMLMDDAIEIRYHLEAALEDVGAAGLIRAGK